MVELCWVGVIYERDLSLQFKLNTLIQGGFAPLLTPTGDGVVRPQSPLKVLRVAELVEIQAPACHRRWRGDDACKLVAKAKCTFVE
jgi:hypothetical protein